MRRHACAPTYVPHPHSWVCTSEYKGSTAVWPAASGTQCKARVRVDLPPRGGAESADSPRPATSTDTPSRSPLPQAARSQDLSDPGRSQEQRWPSNIGKESLRVPKGWGEDVLKKREGAFVWTGLWLYKQETIKRQRYRPAREAQGLSVDL